jgi:hypothetical protein
METITNKSLLQDLKQAPFSYNHIRESGLNDAFGIPLLSTIETTKDEGSVIPLQETYCTALYNQMSFSDSVHQVKLEKLINDYKGLKNYSEEELKMYNEAMRLYQDHTTFNQYLTSYADDNNIVDHYFYFKTSTLDSFIRECIITPLKQKYDEIGKQFSKIVVREFKLDKAFEFVRQVYFMESGKDMSLFCNMLFDKLDSYNKCDDENEISGILQDSLKDMMTDDNADMINSLDISFPEDLVIPKYMITEINALDHVNISFINIWPLSVIFDAKMMGEYNQ